MVVGFPKSLNISKALEKREGIIKETTGTLFNSPNSKRDLSKRSDYGYVYEPQIDLAKKWQGWGSQLKPSFEPIIIARKPFKGSLVDNVIKWGVGGINIDECRVETDELKGKVYNNSGDNLSWGGTYGKGVAYGNELGRFPANTILTYEQITFDEVCGGFPYTKPAGNKIGKDINKNLDYNASSYKLSNNKCPKIAGDNGGSASRYFYCAKASRKDRDEGLEEFEEQKVNDGRKKDADNAFQRGATLRHNIHPTVKPTELMQYLVRLVSPKGAIILDPFMGSGSTGKAVAYENKERQANYNFIGIELNKEYCDIAEARIKFVEGE